MSVTGRLTIATGRSTTWQTGPAFQPFVAIHRTAVFPARRGRGYAFTAGSGLAGRTVRHSGHTYPISQLCP